MTVLIKNPVKPSSIIMEPEWKCIRIKRSRLHKDGCSLLTTGAQQTAQTLYTVQQLQKKF
jgi:hypothetical protein